MRVVRSGGLWRTNYFPLRSLCLRHGHVTLTDDPMLTRGREGEGTGREGKGGDGKGGEGMKGGGSRLVTLLFFCCWFKQKFIYIHENMENQKKKKKKL